MARKIVSYLAAGSFGLFVLTSSATVLATTPGTAGGTPAHEAASEAPKTVAGARVAGTSGGAANSHAVTVAGRATTTASCASCDRAAATKSAATTGGPAAQKQGARATGFGNARTGLRSVMSKVSFHQGASTEGASAVEGHANAASRDGRPSRVAIGSPGRPNLNYYLERAADFERRNPGVKAPNYYRKFGNVYVRKFAALSSKDLSPKGLAWRDQTLQRLQLLMEERAENDPEFGALEHDNKAFSKYAYETHKDAYLGRGEDKFNAHFASYEKPINFFDLPDQDIVRILRVPSLKDMLNSYGRAVGFQTMLAERPVDVIKSVLATAKLAVQHAVSREHHATGF